MVCLRRSSFYRLRPADTLTRSWRCLYSTPAAAARPVPAISSSSVTLETFRERAFGPEKPILITKGDTGETTSSSLPAATRWFDLGAGSAPARLSRRLQDSHALASMPYELMMPWRIEDSVLHAFIAWLQHPASVSDTFDANTLTTICPALAAFLTHAIAMDGGARETTPKLVRFEAPFALLMAAVAFNQTRTRSPLTQLYIAQASLSDLPLAMQDDVPPPDLVRTAGRGDVYASSIWLGLAPTYTPWHRDPNPNLFVQLCSCKTVRVMPPKAGERIFRTVQTELMKQDEALRLSSSSAPSSSSRIRGEEMMQGPERQLLHEAVWSTEATASESTLREAHLDAGDMLFIPKGWWHSVKSVDADGRLNGSVNWWFR